MIDAIGLHVMSARRVHADDATVPVLATGFGETRTGRLWCHVRDDRTSTGKTLTAAL